MQDALNQIAETLSAVPDRQEHTMRFSPMEDGENTALWKDLQNVRYRVDDVREDIVLRGGSKADPNFGNPGSTIITMEAFTSSYEGTSSDYILLHFEDRNVWLYNVTSSDLLFFGRDNNFNTSKPLQVINVGRFLYLFDPITGDARYIDLKSLQMYEWLPARKPGLSTSTNYVTTGQLEEKNFWGFQEGAEVIVIKINQSYSTSAEFTGYMRKDQVYLYHYHGGTHITIDGIDYTSNRVFYIDQNTDFSSNGSGTDYDLLEVFTPPLVAGQLDYSPILSEIARITDDNEIYVKNPWEGTGTIKADDSNYLIIPATTDLKALLNGEAKLELSDTAEIEDNPDWQMPELHRTYMCIHEYADGSFSAPSNIKHIDVNADMAATDRFNLRGVEVYFFNETNGVVKTHLFASRWQLDRKNAYAPSPEYPNGPFYYCGAYQPNDTIDDFTADDDLLRHVSEFVPINAGIYNYFFGGELQPRQVDGHKNAVMFGGYTINRPSPEISVTSRTSDIYMNRSGTDWNAVYFMIAYEYSDNTLSGWVDEATDRVLNYYGDTTIHLRPANNGIIEAVHVYVRDERSGTSYRQIGRFSPDDPEFYGYPIDVGSFIDYPITYSLPQGADVSNETITLENYVAYGTPPQLVQIDSQKEVVNARGILGLRFMSVDSERSSVIRYRLAVFTKQQVLGAYFLAKAGEQGVEYEFDSEPAGIPMTLRGYESLYTLNRAVIFQNERGISLFDGQKIQELVDRRRFKELEQDIKSISYHPTENELWALLPGNRFLVIEMDQTNAPRVFFMQYPAANAKQAGAVTNVGDRLYGAFDDDLLLLDEPSETTDRDISSDGPQDIVGSLTSDHLTGFMAQLYLDVIELLGTGYQCQVEADLQQARFDDSARDWKNEFQGDITTGFIDLDMKGTVLQLAARGISPRLRIMLKGSTGGRFSGAELDFEPIEHDGAARR